MLREALLLCGAERKRRRERVHVWCVGLMAISLLFRGWKGGERGDKAEHLSSFYGFTFYIR